MTKADEPAFPTTNDLCFDDDDIIPQIVNGLTKREYFAGLAMQGDMAEGYVEDISCGARRWVEAADALIAELAKAEPEDVIGGEA